MIEAMNNSQAMRQTVEVLAAARNSTKLHPEDVLAQPIGAIKALAHLLGDTSDSDTIVNPGDLYYLINTVAESLEHASERLSNQ